MKNCHLKSWDNPNLLDELIKLWIFIILYDIAFAFVEILK